MIKHRSGKTYRRSRCKTCAVTFYHKMKASNPEGIRETNRKALARRRKERSNLIDQEKYILNDSRGSDRKASRENDLDRDFIREAIKDGCSYCGETALRMTLDRIDNERGHTKDNVVPACLRCNYVRKDMPYEAWLLVAPGMRAAREAEMFGRWTGRVK